MGSSLPGPAQSTILSRAKDYPYPRPSGSYIFCNGTPLCTGSQAWHAGLADLVVSSPKSASGKRLVDILPEYGISGSALEVTRTPVLAIGSNGAPSQLARKFQGPALIPVRKAVLEDFDVVYAPIISSYGSCVATLAHSPGTQVELAITYLTDEQLEHMHKTEGSYNLMRLDNIALFLAESLSACSDDQGMCQRLDSILLYNHQLGALKLSGTESATAIQEIPARCRTFEAKSQPQMQLSLMAFLQQAEQLDQQQDSIAPSCLLSAGPIVSLSPEDVEELTAAFIMENVSDRKMRLQRNRKLAQQTIAFGYLQASIITELALTHT